jgi:hypothetical protein
MVLALNLYDGTIGDDSGHGYTASKSYPITVLKANAVINETINLVDGHKYHLQNIVGKIVLGRVSI